MDGLFDVLLRMAALIALGAAWRRIQPGGLSGDHARGAISTLVYYLLLPALVVRILWGIDLGLDSVRLAITAAAVVAAGWVLGRIAAGALRLPPGRTGALVLASAFPNATYMGLPALDAVLGPVGRSIAVQFDYFACTPILLTIGVVMAQGYGAKATERAAAPDNPWSRLARVPPFWAAIAGVTLNLTGIPLPSALDGLLETLGLAVVPLMLLSLGMSLSMRALDRQTAAAMMPVLIIQLVLLPAFAFGLTAFIGLEGAYRTGAILEAAMPSMVLGIVLCDRYGLDAKFYSLNVTASTLLSLITLPLWLLALA